MPKREESFFQGGIYHIFNKTLDKRDIFHSRFIFEHLVTLLIYYRSDQTKPRYSDFKKLKPTGQQLIWNKAIGNDIARFFTCIAYCFMPNHFHLLVRQETNTSISSILGKVLNALTRWYNLLNHRQGPLFLRQFKVVEIFNENQLKHVSRYIHLNPYSAGLIKNIHDLDTSPITSFRHYLNLEKSDLCNTNYLLEMFNNSRENYRKFVYDQADYQRSLEIIKKSVKP